MSISGAVQNQQIETVPCTRDRELDKNKSLLNDLISKAEKIIEKEIATNNDFHSWNLSATTRLVKVFGADSPITNRILAPYIGCNNLRFPRNPNPTEMSKWNKCILESKISLLHAAIEDIDINMPTQGKLIGSSKKFGNEVFIVHGRNEEKVTAIEKFITKLGLSSVILKDKPNKSRTIIEKFEEECKNVGFAIILMTGDDKGGLINSPIEEYKIRPRQNVIFELGFFICKLGRHRVVALCESEVEIEIPSDYSGVLYIPFDSHNNGWMISLATELKEAGFEINLNNII